MTLVGNFASFADFFSKTSFSKKHFSNTISVNLNPDQAQHFVGPNLGPNSLERLSADNTNFASFADFFFKNNFFEKFFQEYHQSVKQFGSRSGPTFCGA